MAGLTLKFLRRVVVASFKEGDTAEICTFLEDDNGTCYLGGELRKHIDPDTPLKVLMAATPDAARRIVNAARGTSSAIRITGRTV